MADQGETYAAHIEAELKAEYDRTTALNDRATAVTTASSAFLALVLALVALVSGKDFKVTEAGLLGVLVSLIFFTGASVCGFVAALSRRYKVTAVRTLREMINSRWTDHEVDARNTVTYTNIATIDSLREGNNFKANFLAWAAGLQLVAIALLILTLAVQFGPLLSEPSGGIQATLTSSAWAVRPIGPRDKCIAMALSHPGTGRH